MEIEDTNSVFQGFEELVGNLQPFFKENFCELLFMNANVWITFMDEERRIIAWNDAAAAISGYTAGEVVGTSDIWKELYPDPSYRKKVTSKIIEIISSEKGLEKFETTILAKSGEKKSISWNTKEIRDSEGSLRGYIIIGLDITDKIKLQTNFKMLLMNANAFVAYLDPRSRVKIWNSFAEDITGYKEEEVLDSDEIWRKLYPDPEYRKSVTSKIIESISSKKGFEKFETTILRKDGDKRVISWNTKEISDSEDSVRGYFIIGLDITDIVKLQINFKMLLMNANVFVAFLDPQSRIKIWNRFAEAVTGYSSDEVLGSNEIWKKLYPDPDYRKEVTGHIIKIVSDTSSLDMFETGIKTKSGEYKEIMWNTKAILDNDGHSDGYIVIGLDITRERDMEAKIFNYIGQAAMRMKYPVEIIRDNLSELGGKISSDEIEKDDILLDLNIQIKSAEQILENLYDLNQAIQDSFDQMPEDMKTFLSE